MEPTRLCRSMRRSTIGLTWSACRAQRARLRREGSRLQCGLRKGARAGSRIYRQPRRGHFVRRNVFRIPAGKVCWDTSIGSRGHAISRGGKSYDYRFTSIEHVSGACQLFRRGCFEEIEGYSPVASGGIDLIAVLTARMKGWQTRTFLEKISTHGREQGSARHGRLASWFNVGRKDYVLGGHPMWEVFGGSTR